MAKTGEAVRGRVLLVEDEELLRWSVRRYLERRGFAVETAADGAEALSRLAAGRFDVVVTDLAISGPDGLRVAAEARRLHAESQVVIITGQGSKEAVIQALRQGVCDFVEKPFELELLLVSVERALEKAALLRELVRLSRTDGLTGLFNQRHLATVLEAEVARARRMGRPLALLLADVDGFKDYNDRFGHLAGDAALARVAACLRGACRRDVDNAFRCGGDEFVLVLPEADRSVAEAVAGRARALLAAEGLALRLAIGIALLAPGQDPNALLRAADEAMYRDKRAGAGEASASGAP